MADKLTLTQNVSVKCNDVAIQNMMFFEFIIFITMCSNELNEWHVLLGFKYELKLKLLANEILHP